MNDLAERLKNADSLVLADFTGLASNSANHLRKMLRTSGMTFRVIKKRLLQRVFEEAKIALDPAKMAGQLGVVISPHNLVETAQMAFKFHKQSKDSFKLLAGVEIKVGNALAAAEIMALGALPSRDILLGQLVGLIASPIKSLLFVMNERAKKGGERYGIKNQEL